MGQIWVKLTTVGSWIAQLGSTHCGRCTVFDDTELSSWRRLIVPLWLNPLVQTSGLLSSTKFGNRTLSFPMSNVENMDLRETLRYIRFGDLKIQVLQWAPFCYHINTVFLPLKFPLNLQASNDGTSQSFTVRNHCSRFLPWVGVSYLSTCCFTFHWSCAHVFVPRTVIRPLIAWSPMGHGAQVCLNTALLSSLEN